MYRLLIILVCSLVVIANAKSPHVFSIDDSTFHTIRSVGNITGVTSKQFPILKRLSIRRLILETSAIREPHWHPNAHELTYCLVSFYILSYLNINKKKTFFFCYSVVRL
jgi:oxalate decarboxylase